MTEKATKSPLSITRIFLLFFSVTAIIPVLILGSFLATRFHQDIEAKIANLLETGQQFSRNEIENELENLEHVANQASLLSINDSYRQFLQTGNGKELEALLTRLANSKSVDLVALFDTKGNLLASTDNSVKAVHPSSFGQMIRAGLNAESSSGLETLMFGNDDARHIYMLSSAPVYWDDHSAKIIGVLVIGHEIPQVLHVKAQTESEQSQTKYRIFEIEDFRLKHPNEYKKLIQNSLEIAPDTNDKMTSYEEILDNREIYQSTLVPLTNNLGSRVGVIIVSTSKRTEHDIQDRVLAYSIVALLFGILCLSLIAWWFKRTIVNPLEEIAKVANRVAKGDFKGRIESEHAQREIKDAITQFNHMLIELDKNEQLRQNFISSLTHDLRTPLLAEKRALELLQELNTELPQEYLSITKGLQSSNSHLIEMVNKLLELYKYEAGKIPTNIEIVSIPEITDRCFQKLSPLANDKSIQLIQNYPEKMPPIWADSHQIERVFTNLIGNAIENIPSHCQVQISATISLPNLMTLKIEDNGPGLPEGKLVQLFERYGTGQGTQQKIGSGLGLAICKMIVENHGGAIKADNIQPNGLCFTISLPLYQENRQESKQEAKLTAKQA